MLSVQCKYSDSNGLNFENFEHIKSCHLPCLSWLAGCNLKDLSWSPAQKLEFYSLFSTLIIYTIYRSIQRHGLGQLITVIHNNCRASALCHISATSDRVAQTICARVNFSHALPPNVMVWHVVRDRSSTGSEADFCRLNALPDAWPILSTHGMGRKFENWYYCLGLSTAVAPWGCGITHKKAEQYEYSMDTLARSVDFSGIQRCHIYSCQAAGTSASVSGTLEMEHALTWYKITVLTSMVNEIFVLFMHFSLRYDFFFF